MLKSQDSSGDTTNLYEDEITISYDWLFGDELLQNASDILAIEAAENEAEAYGNDSVNGL